MLAVVREGNPLDPETEGFGEEPPLARRVDGDAIDRGPHLARRQGLGTGLGTGMRELVDAHLDIARDAERDGERGVDPRSLRRGGTITEEDRRVILHDDPVVTADASRECEGAPHADQIQVVVRRRGSGREHLHVVALRAEAFHLLDGVLVDPDRLRAFVSPARAEARFRQGVPYYEAFEYLNSRVEVKKVFVCQPFTPVYYLQKPYTVALGRFGVQPHPDIRSVADAVGEVRSLGVTHVLDVNYFDAGFAWPGTGAGRLLYEGKNVRIYDCEDADVRQ